MQQLGAWVPCHAPPRAANAGARPALPCTRQATRGFSARAISSSPSCPASSRAWTSGPACCTATCGRATSAPRRTASPWCSTPPATSATTRPSSACRGVRVRGEGRGSRLRTLQGEQRRLRPPMRSLHTRSLRADCPWAPSCASPGFSSSFYAAYHELIPRAPGFEQRAELYRLYHYLNHGRLRQGVCRGRARPVTRQPVTLPGDARAAPRAAPRALTTCASRPCLAPSAPHPTLGACRPLGPAMQSTYSVRAARSAALPPWRRACRRPQRARGELQQPRTEPSRAALPRPPSQETRTTTPRPPF